MSPNRKLIESYLATSERTQAAELLHDDVEWIEWADGVPPDGVATRGRTAFLANFGADHLTSTVHRITEAGDVLVVEGTAHVRKPDGKKFDVRFVDIFEVESGKIKRLNSFGALLKEGA